MTELPLTPERVWRRIQELKKEGTVAEVRRAAVIGTGTMGPGMGAVLARAGIETALYDVSDEALERAKARRASWPGACSSGSRRRRRTAARSASRPTSPPRSRAPTSCSRRCRRSSSSSTRSSREFEKHVADGRRSSPRTPPASRSRRSPTVCAHPERVVGMHWSNPPHLIPMIEVIPGEQTAQDVVDATCELVRRIGYHPVVEKEVPGFVENRILYAILRECLDLVDRGIIDPEGLDLNVALGHRLQARRDRPDGAARHGRARHLQRRRLVPEPGPLHVGRGLVDDPRPDRRRAGSA